MTFTSLLLQRTRYLLLTPKVAVPFVIVTTVMLNAVVGCKREEPSESPAPVTQADSPERQAAEANEIQRIIEDAWSRFMEGDESKLSELLKAEPVASRIVDALDPTSKLRRELEKGFDKQFPQLRDQLLLNLGIWRGGYWRTKPAIFIGGDYDVEIELFHDERGLNFLHLISTKFKGEWVVADFYAESDGELFSKRAANLGGQAMAGRVNEGDIHRVRRLTDFARNNDHESFRRAYKGLAETIKLDRAILMMASNAAAMLQDTDWADEIYERYINTYGHDPTLLMFELDRHSGRSDWARLADTCATLNERKNGCAPVYYLKAVAELSNNNPQECVNSALKGTTIDPDFLGNWLQAIAGQCELKLYADAVRTAQLTIERFDDTEIDWTAPVFPGFTESDEFVAWRKELSGESDPNETAATDE